MTSAKARPGSPGSGRLGTSGKAWKRTMEARFFSSMFASDVDVSSRRGAGDSFWSNRGCI